MIKNLVSIIIPSRNEKYTYKTVKDILNKVTGDIEVIVILDGWWLLPEEIMDDKRVIYLHYSIPHGMRNAINRAVSVAKGEYILKCDAHVMFAPGFDTELIKSHKDNYVVVPRRYALDPVKWEIIPNSKYPIDYMYLDSDLHGREWREKNQITDTLPKIDELMSSQGSCWFMKKDYFNQLRLLDEESYGMFWNEFQEIGLKCWLYQGRVMVNKNTWYAHWHKTESRGYNLDRKDHDKAIEHVKKWLVNMAWVDQQRHPLSWLIKRFWPVPSWSRQVVDNAIKDEEVMFWRKWLKGDRGARHAKLRPLAKEIVEMIGDKKEVSIADIGSGPISTIGYTLDGVKVNYVPSDLLADEYKKLYEYHNLYPPVKPEYQDMTKLTYLDESFDIVYCRNALDHCLDAYKALKEMYRVCKKGGYIYLWHFEKVAKMMGYTGMHQWNIELKDGDCLFSNKEKQFLLSEINKGFVNSEVQLSHKVIISKLHK
jgi:glycosyltransferase involved in cell wall biosynthesis